MVEAGIPAIRMYFFGFFMMSLQFAGQSVFVGLGKSRNAVFFSIFRKVIIVIPYHHTAHCIRNGNPGDTDGRAHIQFIGGAACFGTMLLTVWPELKRGRRKDQQLKEKEPMKRPYMKAAVILGAAAFLFTSGFARAEDHAAGTAGYLKSATYYSDDWVINFWNSESGNIWTRSWPALPRTALTILFWWCPGGNSSRARPHVHTTNMPGTSWTVSWMQLPPRD